MTKANEKVTVPQDIAEAIEHLRTLTDSNYGVMRIVENVTVNPVARRLYVWAFERNRGGSPDLLMQALVNGYEVEKSPEEGVREYYESTRNQFGYMYGAPARAGIMQTLNILGIKIEGVNA